MALGALGVAWVGLGRFFTALATRGIQHSRIDLWTDMLPMVPRFPLFGAGLDAFSTAYMPYQTVAKVGPDWIGEAHNEYLQVLLDLGVVGAILVAALLVIVFRRALRRAARQHGRPGAAGGARRRRRPQPGGLRLADPGQRGDLGRPGRPRLPGAEDE